MEYETLLTSAIDARNDLETALRQLHSCGSKSAVVGPVTLTEMAIIETSPAFRRVKSEIEKDRSPLGRPYTLALKRAGGNLEVVVLG